MINGDPVHLVACGALLGEGPTWDPRDASLWWVDILGPAVWRWTAEGVRRFDPPFQVTALAPHTAGGFIAATARGPAHIDPLADRWEPFEVGNPEPDRPANRTNDGKLDRAGRFWFGTMSDGEAPTGAFYRVDHDGATTRVGDGYRVTNGPAFSPDGRTMYAADSPLRLIHAYDLAADGTATNRRDFARFEPYGGAPDGMTVDCEGALWCAFWDGGCLRRFAPDGARLAEIPVPVRRPTSVTFGGPDLATLYITSASVDLAGTPGAGDVYALKPGVAGLPDTLFGAAQ